MAFNTNVSFLWPTWCNICTFPMLGWGWWCEAVSSDQAITGVTTNLITPIHCCVTLIPTQIGPAHKLCKMYQSPSRWEPVKDDLLPAAVLDHTFWQDDLEVCSEDEILLNMLPWSNAAAEYLKTNCMFIKLQSSLMMCWKIRQQNPIEPKQHKFTQNWQF